MVRKREEKSKGDERAAAPRGDAGGPDAGAPASAADVGDARQLLRVTSDRRGWPDSSNA